MAETKPISFINGAKTSDDSVNEQDRIEHVLSNLLKLASGDFKIEELPHIQHDNLDAIDRGVVMLGEHLEASKIEHEKNVLEKENLLKEVHHRVKNNLQIISSLLNLQSKHTQSESAIVSLKQSQHRINSMAMIHEMLYKSEKIALINFEKYLKDLTNMLIESIKGNTHFIELNISAPEIYIDLDTAVSLGLLINEIVTNSIVHGIPENVKGEIYVSLSRDQNNELTLKTGDNGVGFNDSENHDSLGLELIETLANQLDAKLSRKIENGTHYLLKFVSKSSLI